MHTANAARTTGAFAHQAHVKRATTAAAAASASAFGLGGGGGGGGTNGVGTSGMPRSGRVNANYLSKMAAQSGTEPIMKSLAAMGLSLSSATPAAGSAASGDHPASQAPAIPSFFAASPDGQNQMSQAKHVLSSFMEKVQGVTRSIGSGVGQLSSGLMSSADDLRIMLLDDPSAMGLQPAYDLTATFPQGIVSWWRAQSFETSWAAAKCIMLSLDNAGQTIRQKPAMHEWTTCCTSQYAKNGLYVGGVACISSTSPTAVLAKLVSSGDALDTSFGVEVGVNSIPGMRLDLQPEPSFVRRIVYGNHGTVYALVGVGNGSIQTPMSVVMALHADTGLSVDTFGGAGAYVSINGSQPVIDAQSALAARVMAPGSVLIATDAIVSPLDMVTTSDNRLLVLVDAWDGVTPASRSPRLIALDMAKGTPILTFGVNGVVTLPTSGTSGNGTSSRLYSTILSLVGGGGGGGNDIVVGGSEMVATPRSSSEVLLVLGSNGVMKTNLTSAVSKQVDAVINSTHGGTWWSDATVRQAAIVAITAADASSSSALRLVVNVWNGRSVSSAVTAGVVVVDMSLDGTKANTGVWFSAPDAVHTQALSASRASDGTTAIVGRALTVVNDLLTSQLMLGRVSPYVAEKQATASVNRLMYSDGQYASCSAVAAVPTGFMFVGSVQRGKHAMHRWAFVGGANTTLAVSES